MINFFEIYSKCIEDAMDAIDVRDFDKSKALTDVATTIAASGLTPFRVELNDDGGKKLVPDVDRPDKGDITQVLNILKDIKESGEDDRFSCEEDCCDGCTGLTDKKDPCPLRCDGECNACDSTDNKLNLDDIDDFNKH